MIIYAEVHDHPVHGSFGGDVTGEVVDIHDDDAVIGYTMVHGSLEVQIPFRYILKLWHDV